MFIYYIIDIDELQPVHLLVKGGHGRGYRCHCCPPCGGSDTRAPMGKLGSYSWGVTQLAWQNSMQMYSKRMTRKLSFHSSTDWLQETLVAAPAMTAIEMWEPPIQSGIVNPAIPPVKSQVSHQILTKLCNSWVPIWQQVGANSTKGGVWNARDDAGTSTSIPKRDMLTQVI